MSVDVSSGLKKKEQMFFFVAAFDYFRICSVTLTLAECIFSVCYQLKDA